MVTSDYTRIDQTVTINNFYVIIQNVDFIVSMSIINTFLFIIMINF